tara:strand:- start:329 stop:1009 length:681 start_codon:yes stop_codon:yes gene_type:complete
MNIEINVPTTLSEITLEQYQRFARLEGDDDFLTRKVLEIFCGVPYENLIDVRYNDVQGVLGHITSMLAEKPPITLKTSLNGKQWGFIPRLDDISYGEFVDLDTYLRETDTLHKAMAVLYRPIKSSIAEMYSIEGYKGADTYGDTMKQMPMDVVMGALVFFWNLANELLQATLLSLQDKELMETNGQPTHNSKASGDGTQHSISSLMAMYEDLMPLQSSPFTNASHS